MLKNHSTSNVLVWRKRNEVCQKSAKMFQSYVPSCEIYEAKSYNHGYLSLYLPNEWLEIAEPFFQKE